MGSSFSTQKEDNANAPRLTNPTNEDIVANINRMFANNRNFQTETSDISSASLEKYGGFGGNLYDRKRYEQYNEVLQFDQFGGNFNDSLAELNAFHKTLLSRCDGNLSAEDPEATENVGKFFGIQKKNDDYSLNKYNVVGGANAKKVSRFVPADDGNSETSNISDPSNNSNSSSIKFSSSSNKKNNSSESSYITTLPFYSTESSYYSFQHPYVANRFDN